MYMYVLLVGAKTKTALLWQNRCDTERNCQILNKYQLLTPLHHYINPHIAYRPSNQSDKLTCYKNDVKRKMS